jgi:hypothetical protein
MFAVLELLHLGHTATSGPGFTVILGALLLLLGAAMFLRGRYE